MTNMGIRLLAFVVVLGVVFGRTDGQAAVCKDLDTTACVRMQKQLPTLCNDAIFADKACKRFCGLCPLVCFNCTVPVLDKHSCNTTTECPMNETCMLKHLRARDGHHEYIMQCEKKQICDGLGMGFPFGKRDTADAEEDVEEVSAEREERDVSLSCCDTDLCNFPHDTTTTSSTTPSPSSGCHRDVVFVIDDSGSVGRTNFEHAMDFVREIINAIHIGPTGALVSLVQYSTHPQIDWTLTTYTTKAALLQASHHVRYQAGGTVTGDALAAVRVQVLQTASDRRSADNVVVVMTDGNSNDKSDTIDEANLIHHVSRDVIAIGIGNGVSLQELNVIATDSHHIVDVSHYTSLSGTLNKIVSLICT